MNGFGGCWIIHESNDATVRFALTGRILALDRAAS